jgi:heptosyltransferase-1
MEKILIVRLGAMGDIVHALPAVEALRRTRPGLHISWAVEGRWAELLAARGEWRAWTRGSQEKPVADRLHFVNLRAWRRAPFSNETWREARAAWRAIRREGYDAAIDLQGSWKSACVARWSGAPDVIGFDQTREWGAASLYTRRVPPRGAHVVEHAMELAAALGAERTPLPPSLPRDPVAERWAEQIQKERGAFVVMAPGAGWGAKCWPAARYGEVARALGAHGLTSLINIAPGEDTLAGEVEAAGGGRAARLTCSVGEMIALLRRARLFVGGDTGPLHVAAALGVPVVAIFGPTDPARNGPFGTRSIVLRSPESATSYSHVASAHAGLMAIPAEAVASAARTLLGGAHG